MTLREAECEMFTTLDESKWLTDNEVWSVEYQIVSFEKEGVFSTSYQVFVKRRNCRWDYTVPTTPVPLYVQEMIDDTIRKCKRLIAEYTKKVADKATEIVIADSSDYLDNYEAVSTEKGAWRTIVMRLSNTALKTIPIFNHMHVVCSDFYRALIVDGQELVIGGIPA